VGYLKNHTQQLVWLLVWLTNSRFNHETSSA